MQRRISLPLVAIASFLTLGLTACGDDSTSTPATQPTTGESLPPVTTPPPDTTPGDTGADGIEHPTGADDVVLQISSRAASSPSTTTFAAPAGLLVTGDGRVIQQGPQIEIYPGPLLPNMHGTHGQRSRHPGSAALAEEHGLFADVEYSDPTNIADAPYTMVDDLGQRRRRTCTRLRARHGRRRDRDRRGAGEAGRVRRAGDRRRHRRPEPTRSARRSRSRRPRT